MSGFTCRAPTGSVSPVPTSTGTTSRSGGLRRSNVTGYLRHADKRLTLNVDVNMLARQIVPDGRRATGVQVGDRIITGAAIILAGGAFNSPQLLQLSGTGPGALPQKMGI